MLDKLVDRHVGFDIGELLIALFQESREISHGSSKITSVNKVELTTFIYPFILEIVNDEGHLGRDAEKVRILPDIYTTITHCSGCIGLRSLPMI